jgi:hypothetical protein
MIRFDIDDVAIAGSLFNDRKPWSPDGPRESIIGGQGRPLERPKDDRRRPISSAEIPRGSDVLLGTPLGRGRTVASKAGWAATSASVGRFAGSIDSIHFPNAESRWSPPCHEKLPSLIIRGTSDAMSLSNGTEPMFISISIIASDQTSAAFASTFIAEKCSGAR